MPIKRVELVLVGVNAGKTMKINSLQFVNGSHLFTGDDTSLGYITGHYSHYSAYAKGSPEYLKAVKDYEAVLKEKEDGERDLSESTERDSTDASDSEVRPTGEGLASPPAADGSADASGQSGSAGILPGGDGHSDPGVSGGGQEPNGSSGAEALVPPVPEDAEVKAIYDAVMKLDGDNDAHWTPGGIPKLSEVEVALGRGGVTRPLVKKAVGDWTREKAKAQAAADLL